MKTFRFNLESVRDLREDRQTAAMLALAGRIRAHEAARVAAERSRERQRRSAQVLAGLTAVPASALQQAERARAAATIGLEAAQLEVADRAFGVDAARADLVEARRALETVQKLEAAQRAAHRAEVARIEERELADAIEARSVRQAYATRRARGRAG